ncbi:hypothetical protein [Companilactobacillus bobalius]|uniref:hypothetical protein n=1 Tax=Companilactobacillus bobalius TaxID=2801451 RepID=UPI0013027433|nr:hypothetical protein [Companilactobacillus bobalius]
MSRIDIAYNVYVYDIHFTHQNKTGGKLAPGTQWVISSSVSDGAQGKSWDQN